MSDLLKQAIADAKAVRATALSNARVALEEHFAPKLQSMLSEKLKAEVEASEDESLPVADAPVADEAPAAPEVSLDAAPAADAVPMDAAPVSDEAPMDAAPVADEAPMDAAPAADDEIDEEAMRGTIASELDPTMAFLEEGESASSDYKKTTSGHKTDNKGQEIVDAEKLSTKGGPKAVSDSRKASPDYKKDAPASGPVKDMHNKSPKTDDPQGASNELSKGMKKTESSTPALKENEEVDEASLDEILKELEASVQDVGMEDEAPVAAGASVPAGDEEIDLNELLSEDDDKDADDKKEDKDEDDKKPDFLKENLSLKKELQEYRSTVIYLRDRINEINLLNAKLLYTNKLFKQANLTNEQKLKVVESFDLTKSVREAKLVYTTLAESFNFGAKKNVEPAKKPVSTTVKAITEGLASKSVASTKPTNPAVLTEGAEMANRFKKLAGIRK